MAAGGIKLVAQFRQIVVKRLLAGVARPTRSQPKQPVAVVQYIAVLIAIEINEQAGDGNVVAVADGLEKRESFTVRAGCESGW